MRRSENKAPDKPDHEREKGEPVLTEEEAHEVEERLRLRAPVIYQIVRQEGVDELARPVVSLWWSGLAAGLGISMSVVSEGFLRQYLPDAPWRPLVENFGYCIGFLIVVMGRLQLFTENTITVVLPVVAAPSRQNLYCMARLWSIVFIANVCGALLFAIAATYGGLFSTEQVDTFLELANHFMDRSTLEMLLHGIPSGFLIAAMVWMMPSAEGADLWVIIIVTYIIALGDMVHVVAGSAEAFLALFAGDVGLWKVFGGFMAPAFVGNVIGGTALFTMLAYAQVKEEIEP